MYSHLRFEIKSTVDMAAMLNRQFIGSSVLSLENGPIEGTVQILPLPNLGLVLIELNKKVVFYADRKAGKYHFSVNLSDDPSRDNVMAQGVTIARPAIFGFNKELKDLDLQLSTGCRFCSIIIPELFLMAKLSEYSANNVQDILNKFNILSSSNVPYGLILYLSQLWSNLPSLVLSPAFVEDEILSALIECFISPDDRKLGVSIDRCDRHEAALQVLALTNSSPTKPFEIQDLCSLLHQSRTSVFNGCKEKFKMSPLQVVRSVRLHQVRHALMDIEFCIENNIHSVSDVASHFGFVGRSHFARYYKQEFLEMPSQTLSNRRHADHEF
jgi:AraC-like DNA-binding protein